MKKKEVKSNMMNIVVQISKAKNEITSLINHYIRDYDFPSAIIEGILNNALSDVRDQEVQELSLELQHLDQEQHHATHGKEEKKVE